MFCWFSYAAWKMLRWLEVQKLYGMEGSPSSTWSRFHEFLFSPLLFENNGKNLTHWKVAPSWIRIPWTQQVECWMRHTVWLVCFTFSTARRQLFLCRSLLHFPPQFSAAIILLGVNMDHWKYMHLPRITSPMNVRNLSHNSLMGYFPSSVDALTSLTLL